MTTAPLDPRTSTPRCRAAEGSRAVRKAEGARPCVVHNSRLSRWQSAMARSIGRRHRARARGRRNAKGTARQRYPEPTGTEPAGGLQGEATSAGAGHRRRQGACGHRAETREARPDARGRPSAVRTVFKVMIPNFIFISGQVSSDDTRSTFLERPTDLTKVDDGSRKRPAVVLCKREFTRS